MNTTPDAIGVSSDEERALKSVSRATSQDMWLIIDRIETVGTRDRQAAHTLGTLRDALASAGFVYQPSNTLALKGLSSGTYYDGTYEWEKDEDGWTPIQAPSGMPSLPEFSQLRRVVKHYEPLSQA